MMFKTGRIFPARKTFSNIYCAKRPSTKPALSDESANKGIQSWLPQTKLKSKGEKLRHKATVAHNRQEIAVALSEFFSTGIYFQNGLLLDNVRLKWLIYSKFFRSFFMKYLAFIACLFFAVKTMALELRIEDKAVYDVSLAVTNEEQKRGLMFVRKLEENRGMLFDFRRFRRGQIVMWMKNTYIPLDMVFINCDFEIVDIYENAKPMSLDLIRSNADCCYVLEINGGDAARKNIAVGDKVLYTVQK